MARTSGRASEGDASGRHVLIIDDDAMWRTLLAKRLRASGYAVDTAESAYKATAKLREQSYDLLLLDIVMPGMTGIDLLKSAVVRSRLERPPIIAISSVEDESTQSRCIALGVDAFLPKPIDATRLLAEVERVLGIDSAPAARSTAPDRTCRFITRCPMFPVFRSRSVLRVYQLIYCYRKYETCSRYKLASCGTMPEPTLLPDGSTLTPEERDERSP